MTEPNYFKINDSDSDLYDQCPCVNNFEMVWESVPVEDLFCSKIGRISQCVLDQDQAHYAKNGRNIVMAVLLKKLQ